jgi:hypothetical protein
MLTKPKNNLNRFDGLLIVGLILALIIMNVYRVSTARAESSISAKNKQKEPIETYSVSLEEYLFSPQVVSPDKTLSAVLTGYSSTPDQTDDSPFISASGKYVYDGMVANNCLPFGTRIKIPKLFGEKVFTVHDRMNKRYGCGKFDIWMDAPKKEIFQFGIKRAEVQVFYVKAQKTELARLP